MSEKIIKLTSAEITALIVANYPDTPIVGSTVQAVWLYNQEAKDALDPNHVPKASTSSGTTLGPIDWAYFDQFIGEAVTYSDVHIPTDTNDGKSILQEISHTPGRHPFHLHSNLDWTYIYHPDMKGRVDEIKQFLDARDI